MDCLALMCGESGKKTAMWMSSRGFLKGLPFSILSALPDFLEEKLKLRVDVVSDRAIRQELREQILKEVVMV